MGLAGTNSFLSAPCTLGVGEDSVSSAAGTFETGEDSAMSTHDTLGTGEDSVTSTPDPWELVRTQPIRLLLPLGLARMQ